MRKQNAAVLFFSIALMAFLAGRWSIGNQEVRANSDPNPQIEVRPIGGDTSLTVFYPGLNKLFVYQNPFVGMPTWQCSYAIQLSTPGGPVERKPCSTRKQF
jgi:hypothetical protein